MLPPPTQKIFKFESLHKPKFILSFKMCSFPRSFLCGRLNNVMIVTNVKYSNLFVKACPAELALLFAVAFFTALRVALPVTDWAQRTCVGTDVATHRSTRHMTHKRPNSLSNPAFCLGTLLLGENQQHEE